MPTYIVVKQGVYIQEVYGPFGCERAKDRAVRLARENQDDYHSYDVFELKQNGSCFVETQPLASYRKQS